jgi:hypothetical protein
MKVFNEYKPTVYLAALSWGTSVGLVLGRAFDVIPSNFTSLTIFTIGIGVAATVSISRFRLTDAITQVFRVGLTVHMQENGRDSHKYADELIHHLSTCSICKSGGTVVRRCTRGKDLVSLTLKERHGMLDKEEE